MFRSNSQLAQNRTHALAYIPQELLAKVWTEIRAKRDGAKVVWISKQKTDSPPTDFFECERRRFVRALGHALKYTPESMSPVLTVRAWPS
jgi:hypothetical protein